MKTKNLKQILASTFVAGALVIGLAGCEGKNVSESESSYSNQTVSADNNQENRLYSDGHHFMSVIKTGQGAISIRPHPGDDVNGWGSSLYMQPFLPGATLKNTSIESIAPSDNGVSLRASGKVSKGSSETYGDWNLNMNFTYDNTAKKISGSGTYTIALDALLGDSTGDLNLYKLASSYLNNVPLLSGGKGDTGDMKKADISGNGFSSGWIPPEQPAYFPGNITDTLTVDAVGCYNNVDSASQGYARIEPAQKPSVSVTLSSQNAGTKMIFGGIYNTSKSKDFWEDNVGITPLILKSSPAKNYNFKVNFESTP